MAAALTAKAAVQTGERQVEMRELEVQLTDEDHAILEVEANGMCGTDFEQYEGNLGLAYPFVAGHEIVGRIHSIGSAAAQRWGVDEGARVAVKSLVGCGACFRCAQGLTSFCQNRVTYGLTSMQDAPTVWGGYAQYMLLEPTTELYDIPEHLSPQDAVLFNPIGAGFDWGYRVAGTQVGDTVVVIGPGQRGLACVIAAKEAGAAEVIVAGRGRRPWKLELARQLGATHTVDTDQHDLVEAVAEITGGRLADRVIETSPRAIKPIIDAVGAARPEGTVVLAGVKGDNDLAGLRPDALIHKALTIKSVYAVSNWARKQAIRIIASGKYDLSGMHTHTLPVDDLDRALRILGGEVEGEEAMHITVVPS